MRTTSLTVMGRFEISAEQIASLKSLLGFTDDCAQVLSEIGPAMSEWIDWIVDEFYKRLMEQAGAVAILEKKGVTDSLKAHLRKYIRELFDGDYGDEYAAGRIRIGQTHHKIGVSPQLYLAAAKVLLDILREVISQQRSDEVRRRQTIEAVEKIVNFDITLVLETYMQALQSALKVKQEEIRRYTANLENMVARRTRQLAELAMHDGLTGLYNLRSLLEQLGSELAGCKRRSAPLSLVYFDLDGFKQLNDNRGHRGGDKVLVSVAKVLRHICRASDIPVRYGGDEFCVILPDTPAGQAEVFSRRLLEAFDADPFLRKSGTSLSVGIAQTGPQEFVDVDTIIRFADTAMYKAKEHRGHKICVYGRD